MKKKIILLSILCLVAVFGMAQSGKKKVVAGIIFQEDSFMRYNLLAMRDVVVAKPFSGTFLEGSSFNKIDEETKLVGTYVSRGVDAIVITPVDDKASIPALKAAKERGIKVIIYNTGLADKSIYEASYMTSAEELGSSTGKVAKEFIQKNYGTQPVQIAVLQFKTVAPVQSAGRVGGFTSEIKALKNVKIVADQDAWLTDMGVSKGATIITANPNLNIIYAANEGGTIGATLAVKNANKQGKIFVFGTDGSPQIAELLMSSDNILQAATSQSPYLMGKLSAEAAVKVLNGEKITQKDNNVPTVLLSRDNPQGIKAFNEEATRLSRRKK